MAYILKIKYDGTLRRVPVQCRTGATGPDLTYSQLESKIRDIFQIPSNLNFSITYVDKDNDEVTIGEDQDIDDALVTQGLNPLRLDVFTKTQSNRNRSIEFEENKSLHADRGNRPDGIDKYIQIEETHSVKAPEIYPPREDSIVSQGSVKSDTKYKQQTEDVPLSFTPPNSFINFSDSFIEDLDFSNDQTFSLNSNSSLNFSPSIFSENSNAIEDNIMRDSGFAPYSMEREKSKSAFHSDFVNMERKFDDSKNPAVSIPESEHRMLLNNSIHEGVTCDSCGMLPIVGLRFKSSRKYDFDLCGKCYNNVRDKDEYFEVNIHPQSKIVSPLASFQQSGRSSDTIPFHVSNKISSATSEPATATVSSRSPDFRAAAPNQNLKGKLNSQVVRDVTVLEGASFPIGTRFTKTWRLKNTGKYPWPAGTKLARVAGDDLGSQVAVIAELLNGVPPESEVDASVDLVAPAEPGHYACHWRLMMPNEEKFGNLVWVLIKAY